MKIRDDGRMVELEFILKLPFLDIYFKILAHSLLVHGHSSWSTFGLHTTKYDI